MSSGRNGIASSMVPTTWAEARAMVGARPGYKSRVLALPDGSIGFYLFETPIIRWGVDGSVRVHSGGHRTKLTADALRRVLWAHGWQLDAKEWRLVHRTSGANVSFTDGMEVSCAR